MDTGNNLHFVIYVEDINVTNTRGTIRIQNKLNESPRSLKNAEFGCQQQN